MRFTWREQKNKRAHISFDEFEQHNRNCYAYNKKKRVKYKIKGKDNVFRFFHSHSYLLEVRIRLKIANDWNKNKNQNIFAQNWLSIMFIFVWIVCMILKGIFSPCVLWELLLPIKMSFVLNMRTEIAFRQTLC